jgi:uncharacterized membrane protein
MNEPVPFGIYYAIAAMAAVTIFARFSGFWMMGRVTLTPRILRMLEALPGSVVAALVVPVIAKEGLPAGAAMVVVAALMIWRRNEFIALAAGLAVAASIRALGY